MECLNQRNTPPPPKRVQACARGRSWWLANQTGVERTLAPSPDAATTAADGVLVVAVCDRVASSAGAALVSGGIVAFYVAVVLTAGRYLRSILGGSSQRVVYEEMVDTTTVRDLCDGVYLARGEGDLMREHELFKEVVTLLRSPETLLQVTGGADRAKAE